MTRACSSPRGMSTAWAAAIGGLLADPRRRTALAAAGLAAGGRSSAEAANAAALAEVYRTALA